MSQYPDELGAWWTEFPGSDRAAWLTPSSSPLSELAPAQDSPRGAVSRRALKRRLIIPAGRRERAKREAVAQWRRETVEAIRKPSLKSGVITLGSGFGGTGKTDVAVTLAATTPPRGLLTGSSSPTATTTCPMDTSGSAAYRSRRCRAARRT